MREPGASEQQIAAKTEFFAQGNQQKCGAPDLPPRLRIPKIRFRAPWAEECRNRRAGGSPTSRPLSLGTPTKAPSEYRDLLKLSCTARRFCSVFPQVVLVFPGFRDPRAGSVGVRLASGQGKKLAKTTDEHRTAKELSTDWGISYLLSKWADSGIALTALLGVRSSQLSYRPNLLQTQYLNPFR